MPIPHSATPVAPTASARVDARPPSSPAAGATAPSPQMPGAAPAKSLSPVPADATAEGSQNWEVEVFFDGDCPLCRREINWLRKRDRNRKVRFTDISATEFDPTSTGKSFDELMARIHGRIPSGQLIEGVEVFRKLYAAVGLGWLVAPTRLPGIRQLLDLGYRFFARYRLRLTGRCSAQTCGTKQA